MQLPRVDVGYSAFIAALVALMTTLMGSLLQETVVDWFVVLPPILVVVVMFLVGYLVADAKEITASVAGAVLVIIQVAISSSRGEVVDMALVTTAFTYIFNVVFVFVLPRIQPIR